MDMKKVEKLSQLINKNDADAIIEGLNCDSAFLNISAMLHSLKLQKHTQEMVDCITKLEKNDVLVGGYVVGEVASAVLHVMGVKKYEGTNPAVYRRIEDFEGD